MLDYFRLFRLTYSRWSKVRAPRLAAALTFYTVLSLSPLLIVAVGVAQMVFGEAEVRDTLVNQVAVQLGAQAAITVQRILENAGRPGSGAVGTLIGIVILLVGASNVFHQLQEILDRIWGVTEPQKPLLALLRERLLAFVMVLGSGLLLLIILTLRTALNALQRWLPETLPMDRVLVTAVEQVATLLILTTLFALIFKTLPRARVAWRDVWVGAAVTGFLFAVGLHLITWYLSSTTVGSAYGAAGSLLVTLLAVYYAAQIFLFGAQFTQVFSRSRLGSTPPTASHGPAGDEPSTTAARLPSTDN